jgi:hypothetical protein
VPLGTREQTQRRRIARSTFCQRHIGPLTRNCAGNWVAIQYTSAIILRYLPQIDA